MPFLLRAFPLQDPREDGREFLRRYWSDSLVIHARGRYAEYPEHAAPLSVKCTFAGVEHHAFGRTVQVVDPSGYLVTNHGQRYRAWVGDEPVESMSITFQRGLAEEVLGTLVQPADRLLDDPTAPSSRPVCFFERTYPHDGTVSPVLDEIRHAAVPDELWLDERLRLLLERLLFAHRGAARELARLGALRPATRVEQYRRLLRGRAHLDAHLGEPVRLAEAARAACLAPHHFLRLFRRAFAETPHAFLVRRRLERAGRLLATTDLSVTRIALEVGFEGATSFGRAFRRHFGVPPSHARRNAISVEPEPSAAT